LDGIQVARFFEYGNSTSSQASVLVEPRCDSVISVFLLVFYPYRGILFLCSLKSSMLSGLPMKRESEKGLGWRTKIKECMVYLLYILQVKKRGRHFAISGPRFEHGT